MLDIFNNDAFGVIQLTDAMNNVKYVPSRIAEMGLFTTQGLTTTAAAIESRNGVLVLIPPSPRGGPGTTIGRTRRSMMNINVPHFEVNDNVMAEEVQGVRAFGTENALLPVQTLIAERGVIITQGFDATEEWNRMGAIRGIVNYPPDAQGEVQTLDLFTAFGVVKEAEIDFDLDNASPVDGVLRRKITALQRQMGLILEGLPYRGIYAFCGDNFFDDLLQHKEVRDTFKGWSDAQILREGYINTNKSNSWGSFEFANVVFENYRGYNGIVPYIHPDKCHFFPVGVPGFFKTYYSPADYMETVNTVGRRLYAKIYPMANGKGVHFDQQMNALSICTRPKALIQGKR